MRMMNENHKHDAIYSGLPITRKAYAPSEGVAFRSLRFASLRGLFVSCYLVRSVSVWPEPYLCSSLLMFPDGLSFARVRVVTCGRVQKATTSLRRLYLILGDVYCEPMGGRAAEVPLRCGHCTSSLVLRANGRTRCVLRTNGRTSSRRHTSLRPLYLILGNASQ